ncbi:MAG: MgtC/SapB family protein, partial [Chitinophagaceae bacterium]|nr:MgtC/SapB family protein [Chitinophagaceae bacterium]
MLAWKEILIRLLLASLFGALIGLERERKNWSAGMRTHMMV